MRSWRLAIAAGLIPAAFSPAWGIPAPVPLPSGTDMVVTAYDVFGEVFLEATGPNQFGLPPVRGSVWAS